MSDRKDSGSTSPTRAGALVSGGGSAKGSVRGSRVSKEEEEEGEESLASNFNSKLTEPMKQGGGSVSPKTISSTSALKIDLKDLSSATTASASDQNGEGGKESKMMMKMKGGGGSRNERENIDGERKEDDSGEEWELEEGYKSPGSDLDDPDSQSGANKKEPQFIKKRFIGTNSTHIKLAFVGAPNVGKSSLFNMFIDQELSPVEDSICTTTELYYGTLTPHDYKYEYYNKAYRPAISTRSRISVIDTPPIVKGSALGGLLGIPDIDKLRDVDVLLICVRGFGGDSITSYYDEVNPVNEYFTLMNELMLKDLILIDEALYHADVQVNSNKGGRRKAFERFVLQKAWEHLFGKKKPEFKKQLDPSQRFIPDTVYGRPLKAGAWDNNENDLLGKLNLWTSKETIILLNVNRRDYLSQISDWVEPLKRSIDKYEESSSTVVITVSVEFEDLLRNQIREVAMSQYNKEKKDKAGSNVRTFSEVKKAVLEEHLAANPLQHSAMASVIKESLKAIQVIHFHTYTNRDSKSLSEFKSWAVRQGTTTSEAAGIIDTTIHRNLIRGDVIEFEEFYLYDNNKFEGTDAELKLVFDQKVRNKGKKYVINDGDLLEFKYHKNKPVDGTK